MNPERRAIVSIVAAVLVVVLVTAIILVFGVIPLPEFPSLADQPDPSIPGTVAYVEFDDEPCIFTVPASGGEAREVWCGRDYVEFPAWSSDGLLVLMDWTAQPTYVLIDPATGNEVDRVPIDDIDRPGTQPLPYPPEARQDRADGGTLRINGPRGGASAVTVRLPGGEDRTIVSVKDGPTDYWFVQAQWSPDGEWVLVSDSAGRLLIVADTGDPEARVLVEGLQEWGPQAAWYIPGDSTYTVNIPGK
jgi:hypothetical protein